MDGEQLRLIERQVDQVVAIILEKMLSQDNLLASMHDGMLRLHGLLQAKNDNTLDEILKYFKIHKINFYKDKIVEPLTLIIWIVACARVAKLTCANLPDEFYQAIFLHWRTLCLYWSKPLDASTSAHSLDLYHKML